MAVAQEAAIAKTIEVLGEARALKSVAITSEATGLVEIVDLAPGKRVEAGDLLLTRFYLSLNFLELLNRSVDDLTVVAVPEPRSIVLAVMAALLMAVRSVRWTRP